MPKTKIKDLLKQIGKWMLWDGDREVKSYLEFQELKQAIKSLRKENKRLKKELEAKYRHDDSLDVIFRCICLYDVRIETKTYHYWHGLRATTRCRIQVRKDE